MKTLLVPTDFSDIAANAAMYAVALGHHIGAEKIVLYNGYSMPLATEMTWALLDTEDLRKNSETSLQDLRTSLLPFCDNIELETLSDFGFFEDRVNDIADNVHADLIVMGISGSGSLERSLFGSNALSTIHSTHRPVLIVPPETAWQPVEKIAWACDYHNVIDTTPFDIINRMLTLTKATLHVVHNPPEHKTPGAFAVTENMHLREFLQEPGFEVAVLDGPDLSEAINQYVSEQHIDWLIVVPKKHGWLAGLFTKSHTKELLFHTYIPMLCLHQ